MKFPNLFIVGASRCGASFLYKYLGEHPKIFMSEMKEPSYFCDIHSNVKSEIEYLKLFQNAGNELYVGESSTTYLTYMKSAYRIKDSFPNAKIIITLRAPWERAYSLWNWMTNHKYETLPFEEAIYLDVFQKERKDIKHYPMNYKYFSSSLYTENVKRYIQLFSRKNVYITTLEQIKRNPRNTIHGIYKWLKIQSVEHEYQIVNAEKYQDKLSYKTIQAIKTLFDNDLLELNKLLQLGDDKYVESIR